jgi:hypothetical protein
MGELVFVLFWIIVLGVIGYAPEDGLKILLGLAWLVGGIFALVSVGYALASFL